MPAKATQNKGTETLVKRLLDAVAKMPAKRVPGKTCEVVKVEGKTVGYLVLGTQKVRVDVMENGKLVRYPVANAKGVERAVTAMRKRADARKPKIVAKKVVAKPKKLAEPLDEQVAADVGAKVAATFLK